MGKAINQQPAEMVGSTDDMIGILDVFIHQAHDIHNICIYQKQDVYAKLCLTNAPEATISSQIINAGGKNPVFNESVRLDVKTIESALKCEIWMLSRVKNYLGDQLLGFTLVPLSEVVMANGKLEKEFSLSSTDIFHSPAGFVQLSLSYVGSSPDVMAITTKPASLIPDVNLLDSDNDDSVSCEYEKIEFPDLNVVTENRQMVSEYIGITCADLDCQTAENLMRSVTGECPDDKAGLRIVESFSTEDSLSEASKDVSPTDSVSANVSPAVYPATSQSSSDPLPASSSTSQSDKEVEVAEGEADSSKRVGMNGLIQPLINISIEPEQTVVQQDIVDMYMKSVQETLANMKLPMDLENNGMNTETSPAGSEEKLKTPKGPGSRVFYGSRAFF